MTPAAIILEAAAEGVKLTLTPAGTIKAVGNGRTVHRWLAVIREHKAGIVNALKGGAGDTAAVSRWPAEDWIAYYNERAGIAEFDGGMSRDEAERAAWTLVAKRYRLN
jgi:hypothetical protein